MIEVILIIIASTFLSVTFVSVYFVGYKEGILTEKERTKIDPIVTDEKTAKVVKGVSDWVNFNGRD